MSVFIGSWRIHRLDFEGLRVMLEGAQMGIWDDL